MLTPATVLQGASVTKPEFHDRQIFLVTQETRIKDIVLEESCVTVASGIVLFALVFEGAGAPARPRG